MTSPAANAPLAVVTGATGFLGSHVVDALLEGGWRVRAAVRPTSDLRWLQGKPVRTVVPGETDDGLDRLLAEAAAVVHCAGAINAPDAAGYRAGNVEPTRRLIAAACRASELRAFVYVSSLAAAGPAVPGRPRAETDPPAPISAYGRSKLEAETLFGTQLPFRWAILRPPALYGPRDRAFVRLFAWARRGWTVRAVGGLREMSLLDGRDCAAAAVALVKTPTAHGVYFAADERRLNWHDLAEALRQATQRPVRALVAPVGVLRLLAGRGESGRRAAARWSLLDPEVVARLAPAAWTCDGARLRQDTAWRPQRDLARGFRETWAFYLDAGWI